MTTKANPVIVIRGGTWADTCFALDHEGEEIVLNVTRLQAACRAGRFGQPRCARTQALPPADWSNWNDDDRRKVDAMKQLPEVLDDPAIAIASPKRNFALLCFADGQHRITARQELGLPEVYFYLVPWEAQWEFRVSMTLNGKPI